MNWVNIIYTDVTHHNFFDILIIGQVGIMSLLNDSCVNLDPYEQSKVLFSIALIFVVPWMKSVIV